LQIILHSTRQQIGERHASFPCRCQWDLLNVSRFIAPELVREISEHVPQTFFQRACRSIDRGRNLSCRRHLSYIHIDPSIIHSHADLTIRAINKLRMQVRVIYIEKPWTNLSWSVNIEKNFSINFLERGKIVFMIYYAINVNAMSTISKSYQVFIHYDS